MRFQSIYVIAFALFGSALAAPADSQPESLFQRQDEQFAVRNP